MTELKAKLETEPLEVQKEKVLAEISVLRRTTPVAESIKLIGSMILGIGGAIAAFAGFQLAEVKSEKFKNEAYKAEMSRDAALSEVKELTGKKAVLSKEYSELQVALSKAKTELGTISDQLSTQATLSNPKLLMAVQQANAADIELRSAPGGKESAGPPKTMMSLISRLFDSTASVRGRAYEELMQLYLKDPGLMPSLISYGQENINNKNGVYNALVVLRSCRSKKSEPI
ncbi:hypothetical protein [Pseudomonas chlororaphis]|uniref:hypothetical protein n=1 Tax=Pseudomonas chlororaphis TaxID=587753 RepID=UPI001B305407|nr:hypothetical protein [Pseudomonas chlororaphis]QTT89384.1 hypothetical protein HUT28_19040 [Pseudomonas chlororaphis]